MIIISSLVILSIVIIISVSFNNFNISSEESKEIIEENYVGVDKEILEKLKVGDYVNYGDLIDDNTYVAKKEKTGYDEDKELQTEKKDWRILSINKTTGEVLITTEGIVNNGFYLNGANGYINGVDELENACKKLYSSSFLDLKARSMNVEDLNYIFKYKPKYDKRFAFFVDSDFSSESIYSYIKYNNKSYMKIKHYTGPNENGIFYDCDGGGGERVDENGYKYRTAEENNPVYITRTLYKYDIPTKNKIVREILGEDFGWLASKYTTIYTNYSEAYAMYGLRGANMETVTGGELFGSRERSYKIYSGIRPVVSLDARIIIDTSNNILDGSSPDTAWKLINKYKKDSNVDIDFSLVNKPKSPDLLENLKVGDYVDYTEWIDESTYTTDTENTGYEKNQELKTEKTNWKVLSIDKDTGEVLITTHGIVNYGLYLIGTKGYIRGPEELHRICENLYSSKRLDVKARSMKIEDFNKACGYVMPELERFAIYPKDVEVSGTTLYQGKNYKKVSRILLGNEKVKYLENIIDGGGTNEIIGDDGYKYVEIDGENPVYITKTCYFYKLPEDDIVISKILGKPEYAYLYKGWLASTCVDVDEVGGGTGKYREYLYMYNVGFTGVGKFEIPKSSTFNQNGIYPVISLSSSNVEVDVTNRTNNGSSATRAWKLIKK